MCGGYLGTDLPKRPKRGFHLPIGAWLQGPLRDLMESSLATLRREGPRERRRD
jgi:hypothetical protein